MPPVPQIETDREDWGLKPLLGVGSIVLGARILWCPISGAPWVPKRHLLALGAWGMMHGIVYLSLAVAGGSMARRI